MSLWIPITIIAAFMQNLRTSIQKTLTSSIGTTGAVFVRFGFGMPFALLLLAVLYFYMGYTFPSLSYRFLNWVCVAAIIQISASLLLISLFVLKNYTIAQAYAHTEPMMAVLFGFVFLDDRVNLNAAVSIMICVLGVMLIAVGRTSLSIKALLTSLSQKTVIMGLVAGMGFALSAVCYRGASLALGGSNFVMQGTVTLVFALCFQTFLMLIYMKIKRPKQLARIGKVWKPALLVGLFGSSASLGWFCAMTLQNAALVKAVAQIEMVFIFASSVFYFKEHITKLEVMGSLLIVLSIVLFVI
jgi:drug/metabolite transporter (DMT)-like permease